MAITKERKDDLIAQYVEWAKRSQAIIVTQYSGLDMKNMDALRAKVRESGGEFHIVKNTLIGKALEQVGMQPPAGLFEGSSAICFAFSDAPASAKTMLDFAKTSEFVKVKGGFLDMKAFNPEGVKTLAELPPLPVMRAQLLGVISAPASKLVRTLAEPARQVAAVIKAHAEPEPQPAA